MQVRRSWRTFVALAVAMACTATTCHAPVDFEIQGDLDSGVTFAVEDLTRNGEVTVREVVVGEVVGEELWRLEGRAKLHSLTYASAPEGLSVAHGPVPLRPGHAYYIVVRGDSGWGRDAHGTCGFNLDDEGRVHAEQGC